MAFQLESLAPEKPAVPNSGALDSVREALGRIQFGAIHLTVHDGRLVQVEVTERRRFR